MLESDYYYPCDICGGKSLQDAYVEYDKSCIGSMAVVCNDCARDYEVVVRAKQEPVQNYGGTG